MTAALRFNAHAKIESIENGIVKYMTRKAKRRTAQGQPIPSLPPLLQPVTMTEKQLGKFPIYKPRPEYPVAAHARHLTGAGMFCSARN